MFSLSRLMTPPFSPLEGNFRDMMRTKSTSSTFKESINRGTADPDVDEFNQINNLKKSRNLSSRRVFVYEVTTSFTNSHHISVIVPLDREYVCRNCYRDGFIHKDLFLPIDIRYCWNLSLWLIIFLDGKSFPQI